MKTSRSILCGKRLKHIRTYLGLTQEQFGEKLGDWGIKDKSGNPGRAPEIIASWESGRNQIPPNVIKAIVDNVKYENEDIQWAYLNGDTDYISKGINGIVFSTFNRMQEIEMANPSSGNSWAPVTIEELNNDVDHQLSIIIYEEIFPLLGYDKSIIFDKGRFYHQIKEGLINMIESYKKKEERGE